MDREPQGEALSDAEIALMDATKSVIEALLTAGTVKPVIFDKMFTHQRDSYLGKKMPTAAAVMQMLLDFVTDPEREAHRASLRKVVGEPPAGSA